MYLTSGSARLLCAPLEAPDIPNGNQGDPVTQRHREEVAGYAAIIPFVAHCPQTTPRRQPRVAASDCVSQLQAELVARAHV